jgi:hypothetical protein
VQEWADREWTKFDEPMMVHTTCLHLHSSSHTHATAHMHACTHA